MKEKDDFQVFQLRCMANLLAQISSSRLKKKRLKKYRIPELEVQIVHDWLKIVPLPWKLHICSTKVSYQYSAVFLDGELALDGEVRVALSLLLFAPFAFIMWCSVCEGLQFVTSPSSDFLFSVIRLSQTFIVATSKSVGVGPGELQ